MAGAMGLGGFPHFAGYPGAWPAALGFRMVDVPFSRTIGAGPGTSGELAIPTPVGLEKNGATLIKPFCPPYYRTMEEAVRAFVAYKYASGTGTFRDGGAATAWKDPARVQSGIPAYSEKTIEAVIAYCTYVYERYGRFPASSGPFTNLIAFQTHHLDDEFYTRHYRQGVLGQAYRGHDAAWHRAAAASHGGTRPATAGAGRVSKAGGARTSGAGSGQASSKGATAAARGQDAAKRDAVTRRGRTSSGSVDGQRTRASGGTGVRGGRSSSTKGTRGARATSKRRRSR
jgi:hypothetical protein